LQKKKERTPRNKRRKSLQESDLDKMTHDTGNNKNNTTKKKDNISNNNNSNFIPYHHFSPFFFGLLIRFIRFCCLFHLL